MTVMTMFTLAELHRMQGDLSEAEPMLKRVLAMREKMLRPDDPETATTLASLSFLALTQANYRLAEQYAERALAIRTRALGSEHPDTAMTLVTLGRIRHYEARYTDAEQLFQRALGLFEKALGPEHMNVAVALNNLSQVHKEQGRFALAEVPLRQGARNPGEAVRPGQHLHCADAQQPRRAAQGHGAPRGGRGPVPSRAADLGEGPRAGSSGSRHEPGQPRNPVYFDGPRFRGRRLVATRCSRSTRRRSVRNIPTWPPRSTILPTP